MKEDEYTVTQRCPQCGRELESDAKFCVSCGASLPGVIFEEISAQNKLGKAADRATRMAAAREKLEPWAIKLGERMSRVPKRLMIGIPIALLTVVAIVIALIALASIYSPEGCVRRYLSSLKNGDYRSAYNLALENESRFGTYEYFERWQRFQRQKLGDLTDFRVRPRRSENRFFGRLMIEEDTGEPGYTATLVFEEDRHDVNLNVVDTGGIWPVKRYRVRLAKEPVRIVASPLGASVYIDGMYAGRTQEEELFKEALSLRKFPKDLDDVVEYTKKLMKTFEWLLGEAKYILQSFSSIAEGTERTLNKLGASGVTWAEILNSVDRVTTSGKELWSNIANTALGIYWIFGGGDDGSLRANLSRKRSCLKIDYLPEGYHEVKVEMPGMKTVTKEFSAPGRVDITLKPTSEKVGELKSALEEFYSRRAQALHSMNLEYVTPIVDGDALKEITEEFLTLSGRLQRKASSLNNRKFVEFKALAENVMTVRTSENWDYIYYDAENRAVTTLSQVKEKWVYTLRRRGGRWLVIERAKD